MVPLSRAGASPLTAQSPPLPPRRRAVEKHRPEQIVADPVKLAAVKYGFVVAIETCIDVGQHIISSESLRAPSDFAVTDTEVVRERLRALDLRPGTPWLRTSDTRGSRGLTLDYKIDEFDDRLS